MTQFYLFFFFKGGPKASLKTNWQMGLKSQLPPLSPHFSKYASQSGKNNCSIIHLKWWEIKRVMHYSLHVVVIPMTYAIFRIVWSSWFRSSVILLTVLWYSFSYSRICLLISFRYFKSHSLRLHGLKKKKKKFPWHNFNLQTGMPMLITVKYCKINLYSFSSQNHQQ